MINKVLKNLAMKISGICLELASTTLQGKCCNGVLYTLLEQTTIHIPQRVLHGQEQTTIAPKYCEEQVSFHQEGL